MGYWAWVRLDEPEVTVYRCWSCRRGRHTFSENYVVDTQDNRRPGAARVARRVLGPVFITQTETRWLVQRWSERPSVRATA